MGKVKYLKNGYTSVTKQISVEDVPQDILDAAENGCQNALVEMLLQLEAQVTGQERTTKPQLTVIKGGK